LKQGKIDELNDFERKSIAELFKDETKKNTNESQEFKLQNILIQYKPFQKFLQNYFKPY
jgi:hypothetical protein